MARLLTVSYRFTFWSLKTETSPTVTLFLTTNKKVFSNIASINLRASLPLTYCNGPKFCIWWKSLLSKLTRLLMLSYLRERGQPSVLFLQVNHVTIKPVQVLILEIVIIYKVKLAAAVVVALVVTYTGKVQPLWMTKFITWKRNSRT